MTLVIPLKKKYFTPPKRSSTPEKIAAFKRNIFVPLTLARTIDGYKSGEDNDYWMRRAICLVGKLLVKILFQKRRKYSELRKYSTTELFNVAILSLHKALLKFKVERSSLRSFPIFLAGYIDADFKSIAVKEKRYVPLDNSEHHDRGDGGHKAEEMKKMILIKIELKEALDRLEGEHRITKENRGLFELHYFDGNTIRKLTEVTGIAQTAISQRVAKVREKVRKEVKNFLL
jgi:RNA polymerase sigma factor (sigma-70 family)